MVGETSPLAMMVKNRASTLTSILHCSPFSIDRLYKPAILMKMSRESSSGPGAFPRERRERIGMISFGERVNRPLRRLLGLADCLLDLRGLSSVRFREGGWRSWRMPMLSSLMLATGICLTRRAYADLGLSRSAASWAAFCVSTGSLVYCFLVLLLIWLLLSKRS